MRRGGMVGFGRSAVVSLLLGSVCGVASAGTSGKLSGRIVDEKKAPLQGVNVAIPGVRLGAISDADGRYFILNIPAGSYQVKVALLGYQAIAFQDVIVSADHTTELDAALVTTPVEMKEVVVSARRPVVDLTRTSTLASVDREQIKNLPVQELQDVVNLQAGVVDGHFRGGRKGEVQYQVDGVTVNNVYDNTSTLKLDRSLLEEVQVISGTFDAEYGQAMSGVVNAILRRGGERFRWDAEAMGGGFFYPGSSRLQDFSLRPSGVQNYQLTISGPTFLPKTTYLMNARRYHFDDWFRGTRRFEPTDTSDFQGKRYHPTGDDLSVPLAYSREWSGLAKVTNRSLGSIDLAYQAVFNLIDARKADFAYRLDPDGLPRQQTKSIMHGLDWTHTLGPKTFYTVSLRQNYFDYRDRVYDDLYDRRYDRAGEPKKDPNYELGAYIQGVSPTRFHQTTNAMVLKGSWVSQYRRDQQFKIGGEYQWPTLSFGSMGYIVSEIDSTTGAVHFKRHDNEPPFYPGVVVYHPRLGAAFAQNDVEWNDLRIRAGLRFEYFQANSSLPSDLHNPANAYPLPNPQSVAVPTQARVSLAPRIGVSYPVTRDAALFFAYGHFYQMPELGKIFTDADYRLLATLQGGKSNYRVMGNPNIRPERTVQYQFGYKQAVSELLGVEVSVFYKDIRDLLGVEFINTYNDAQYTRLTNVDFGNVVGFTFTLDQRARGLLSTTLDYTWQLAQGNSSDPNETATRAEAGEDPRPRQVPFNWDQRHTLNFTAQIARPNDFTASAILRAASGQPYTPTVSLGFLGGLETNSGRKPASFLVDVRGEKQSRVMGVPASLFARVFNVFDTRFFNGFVFGSTGSPYYSRDAASDQNTLADPTRYYGPRRVEVGVTLSAGETP